MAWKTVTFESIDIRDGFLHEIFISGHDVVVTKPREGEKKPGKAHKFFGIEKARGPVSFLATDSLAEDLKPDEIPMLIRVQWKGKVPIKGGSQMFNVFACEQFEREVGDGVPGSEFPAWTGQSAFSGQETFIEKESIEEELPDAGPIDKDKSDPREKVETPYDRAGPQ